MPLSCCTPSLCPVTVTCLTMRGMSFILVSLGTLGVRWKNRMLAFALDNPGLRSQQSGQYSCFLGNGKGFPTEPMAGRGYCSAPRFRRALALLANSDLWLQDTPLGSSFPSRAVSSYRTRGLTPGVSFQMRCFRWFETKPQTGFL